MRAAELRVGAIFVVISVAIVLMVFVVDLVLDGLPRACSIVNRDVTFQAHILLNLIRAVRVNTVLKWTVKSVTTGDSGCSIVLRAASEAGASGLLSKVVGSSDAQELLANHNAICLKRDDYGSNGGPHQDKSK
jgi:hypothetical protein